MKTGEQRFRKTVMTRAILVAMCGAGAAAFAPAALAQQASLERVEITGSAVKRVDAEVVSATVQDPQSLNEAKGLLS